MLKRKENIAIILVWLFHLSAIIGILAGHASWFVSKTPFNLLLMFVLLIWVSPSRSIKAWFLILTIYLLGLAVEFLGVHTGWPFGHYSYGENLGVKLSGVPLIIGVNWILLVFSSAEISKGIHHRMEARALIGAGLMVALDFLIETVAPEFDFWSFHAGDAPAQNYLAWFVVAFAMQWIYQRVQFFGNQRFTTHFFFAQVVFFGIFYVFFGF